MLLFHHNDAKRRAMRCPYCKEAIKKLAANVQDLAGVRLIVLCCPHCHTIITIESLIKH